MDFSDALREIKSGRRLARSGWNAPGQWVYLVDGSEFAVDRPPLLGFFEKGTKIRYDDHVNLRNACGACVPWQPTQGDMLGTDWLVLDDGLLR